MVDTANNTNIGIRRTYITYGMGSSSPPEQSMHGLRMGNYNAVNTHEARKILHVVGHVQPSCIEFERLFFLVGIDRLLCEPRRRRMELCIRVVLVRSVGHDHAMLQLLMSLQIKCSLSVLLYFCYLYDMA